MLDQSSDRMWFVIGAVTVGAGIVLIANKLFPEMFEKVSSGFDILASEAVSGMDELIKPGKNYLMDSAAPRTTKTLYIDYDLYMKDFQELRGQTVTLSFEAKSETMNEQVLDVYFRVHDSVVEKTQLDSLVYELSGAYPVNNEYTRYTYTMTVPDFSSVAEFPLSIRFRRSYAAGSGFIYNHDAEAAGHVTINKTDPYTIQKVKLELGEKDSEYTDYEDD